MPHWPGLLPLLTQDGDLTLLAGFGREEAYIDACLSRLQPRRGDAREFALKYRVLLVRTHNGVDVDIPHPSAAK